MEGKNRQRETDSGVMESSTAQNLEETTRQLFLRKKRNRRQSRVYVSMADSKDLDTTVSHCEDNDKKILKKNKEKKIQGGDK